MVSLATHGAWSRALEQAPTGIHLIAMFSFAE